MKYVITYLLTAAFFLGIYYIVFAIASIASLMTDGASNYLILLALAGFSGLIGPITLCSDKKLSK